VTAPASAPRDFGKVWLIIAAVINFIISVSSLGFGVLMTGIVFVARASSTRPEHAADFTAPAVFFALGLLMLGVGIGLVLRRPVARVLAMIVYSISIIAGLGFAAFVLGAGIFNSPGADVLAMAIGLIAIVFVATGVPAFLIYALTRPGVKAYCRGRPPAPDFATAENYRPPPTE
jgi:hypothetical protein